MDLGESGVYHLIVYALIPMLAILYARFHLGSIVKYQSFFLGKPVVVRAFKVFIILAVNAYDRPALIGYMQVATILMSGIAAILFVQPFKNIGAF
jgi:phosphatidylserine synthase